MENENNDDINLDFDNIEANSERKLKAKNRFEQLSEKVITTSKERDDAAAKANAAETARLNAEKERDFYKDFSANVSKYPNAGSYQDKILEKVKAGYSTEDAMVSVLAKEGKLNSMQENQVPASYGSAPIVEGGSSPTVLPGNKQASDMSAADRLNALKEAEQSGDLQSLLRRGVNIGS